MGPGPQEAKQEAAPPGGGRRRGHGLRRLPTTATPGAMTPKTRKESGDQGAVHQSVHSFETVVEAASLSASPGAAAVAAVEVNFDTGAAVTVLPEKYVTQPKDNGVRYKTASGEALRDQGKAEVTGILPGGRGATITGRGAGVHRVLLSGAQA